MARLDCITWNVHRCRGRDGRIRPERTADVLIDLLASSPADLVVLTEADGERPPYGAVLDLDRIADATGLVWAHDEAALRWGPDSHGFLGTVVLHARRLERLDGHLLDLPGLYPRGATFMTFRCEARRFRIIATHLSLFQPLRMAQMRAIGQYLDRQQALPTVLAGDLNEWRPWNGLAFSQRIAGRRFRGPVRRSFPASCPVLPLDRVMGASGATVADAAVVTSRTLRDTSDHLPLRASVTFG